MPKSLNLINEPDREELSSLIAKEVLRVLAHYNEAAKLPSLAFSAVGAGEEATAAPFAQAAPQTAHSDPNIGKGAFVIVKTGNRHEPTIQEGLHQWCNLESLRIEDWAGPVSGATFIERHFGIPRSTLHWWQRHKDVVALQKGARKHVFPLTQFIDGRPTPGMRQVLSLIVNHKLAWLWLTRPSPCLDGRVPIDMLRQDQTEQVIQAAQDFSAR